MASYLRALRSRILTPNVSATSLDTRGFHVKNEAAKELLETVGRSFLAGYSYATGARTPADAEERLEGVAPQFRGFAYEGAAMGFTVLDRLPVGGGSRMAGFLAGRGDDHIYMAYIGIGWAMARLPRFRWPRITPLDPLLRWLVLDGYGFHQAYFHTGRYVHEQVRTDVPWPTDAWYVNHAVDQGIGRALWFVGGTEPDLVCTMIDGFAETRRPDLYGGAGLAATYAGGADESELRAFWDRAGCYRPQVAQGCAFAAEARIRAGLVVPHTHLAARVFCDMTPAQAAELSGKHRPDPHTQADLPGYELWRRRIAGEFASIGRC